MSNVAPAVSSENDTAACTLSLVDGQKSSPRGGFKDIVDAITRQTTAFEVFSRTNFLLHVLALFSADELLAALSHLLLGHRVLPQIFLQAHEYDGHTGAAFGGLIGPLVFNVFQRVRRVDRETNEDDMGLRVGKRS